MPSLVPSQQRSRQQPRDFSFGDGLLGLELDRKLQVVSVQGQAATLGVVVGDRLIACVTSPSPMDTVSKLAGRDIEAVVGVLRAQPRPMTLRFSRSARRGAASRDDSPIAQLSHEN